MYNSELWTLSSNMNDHIDAFHRRQLRYAINITWPNKISNENLYKIVNVEKWSVVIKRRRLNWLGHLARLPDNTPAKLALQEALKPTKKNIGRPPLTWMSQIKKELQELKIISTEQSKSNHFMTDIFEIAKDRNVWKNCVRSAISNWQTEKPTPQRG